MSDAMCDHPILWLAPDVPGKFPNDRVLHQPTFDTKNEKVFSDDDGQHRTRFFECVVPTVCRKKSNATFQLMAGLGKNMCRRRHRPNAENRTPAKVTSGFVSGQHSSDIGKS